MGHRTHLLLLIVAVTLTACGGGGGKEPGEPIVLPVLPDMGISVQQVSFWDPQEPTDNTPWGRLGVNPAQLESETGIRGGWLNVATSDGWVVANLPVPPASEGPFAVYFDLGTTPQEAVQQIALHVLHSTTGLAKLADHVTTPAQYPVARIVVAERGFGPQAVLDPGLPPFRLRLADILKVPLTVNTWTQVTTNVQCAQDQCAPMGVANAFQYLEDMGVWTIPHVHALGLGGDATLVGQLDTLSGRSFFSRASGSGVSVDMIVDGSLDYVATNGIATGMTFRHMDQGWASTLPASDYNAHGLTSSYDGGAPTFAWLWDRISTGCGVAAGYSHASGGHMVRVTGVKVDSAGNEWMRYTHDSVQTGSDPTDSLGLETVWVQLSDLDADGMLNLGAVSRELRVVWAACP